MPNGTPNLQTPLAGMIQERMGARTVAIAEKFDLPYFRWVGRYLMSWGKAQGVTLSEGLALMEEAFPPIVNEHTISGWLPPWLRRGSTRAV
jgi:hypothetical protein